MSFKKIIVFILLFIVQLQAKANFVFNENCKNAYEAIYDLRLDDARKIIQIEKNQNPENGITILLDNYIDFFSLISSGKLADYNRLKDLKGQRLSLIEKQDKNSPYYLFCQAEVTLQWALIKGRFQDFLSSGLDIKKARSLLLDNSRKYPNFPLNKKSLALIDVILGAAPSNVRGLLNTFGFSGSVENGSRDLEHLFYSLSKTPYDFYKNEVAFFLCYIQTDIVNNGMSYQKLITFSNALGNSSLLKIYIQGYLAGKMAHNDDAIEILQSRPTKNGYINFPAINYLLGNAKLNRMDSDANIYLARYLKDYEGINYVKDAYMKLAYYYLLRGDKSKYLAFARLVKTQGTLYDEKDKEALKESNETNPDIDLLKARFYFDGGYYSKALAVLNSKSPDELQSQKNQLEYYYRLGRVYDEMGNDNTAIANYNIAISLGKNTSYYFASNAALNVGKIYEHQNNKAKAIAYYNLAVSMKNHEYENSIETKAKDGLRRLRN